MSAYIAWTALLDRFERDLDAPTPSPEPWHAPDAPLPPELEGRVRSIRRRQEERMLALRTQRDDTARHLDALRRVPADDPAPAAYLDLDG